jgi:hypothetical protein
LDKGGTRFRVSILPFEDANRLWLAASELIYAGFSAAQFGLLGSQQSFETCPSRLVLPTRLQLELDGLLAVPPIRVRLASGDVFEMRCGRSADGLFTALENDCVEAGWMRPDLARRLAIDVASGCFVLVVASTTAIQHALGARLLLRHGQRNLQTHEFSVAHSS